ncbi:MAG: hypothetical protein JST35_06945 [Armatimonadetes bacterium]|nr:hypothetical protein [Armatimonadota bacterium]
MKGKDRSLTGVTMILMGVGGAILYGWALDFVTAHFCIEYFTEWHPDIGVPPVGWMIALAWGVVASWHVGLIGAIIVTTAARYGQLPKLDERWLGPRLMGGLAVCYALSHSIGWVRHFTVIPNDDPVYHRLQTCLYIHNATYATTGLLAFVLAGWAVVTRFNLGMAESRRSILAEMRSMLPPGSE